MNVSESVKTAMFCKYCFSFYFYTKKPAQMNILGISGSPNINGSTAFAVQYALEIIKEDNFDTKFISLANKEITPCSACWKCQEKSECIFDDDMNEIYEALRWCDGLILGSPVCFGMVSGQLKIMMDRTVMLRPDYNMPLELAGKTGCAIACGNFRNGGQETTIQNIHTFLLQHNMKVINDGAGFSHTGATIAGDARTDKLGLQTVKNMALNLKKMI